MRLERKQHIAREGFTQNPRTPKFLPTNASAALPVRPQYARSTGMQTNYRPRRRYSLSVRRQAGRDGVDNTSTWRELTLSVSSSKPATALPTVAPSDRGPDVHPTTCTTMRPDVSVKATNTIVTVAPFGSVTPSKISLHAEGCCKFRGRSQNRYAITSRQTCFSKRERGGFHMQRAVGGMWVADPGSAGGPRDRGVIMSRELVLRHFL